MTNHIFFPGLGIELEINRVAFEIFGRPIYWYAIIIATGFLLAVFYAFSIAAITSAPASVLTFSIKPLS